MHPPHPLAREDGEDASSPSSISYRYWRMHPTPPAPSAAGHEDGMKSDVVCSNVVCAFTAVGVAARQTSV